MRNRVLNLKTAVSPKIHGRLKRFFTVTVIVDDSSEIHYERHNFVVNVLRVIMILILDILPAFISRKIFTMLGSEQGGAKTVSKFASHFQAIETVYTFPERKAKKEINLSDRCWGCILNNSLALRNRLMLVERELMHLIQEVSQRKSAVNLMSLGCGSARAVIEVLAHLNGSKPPVRSKFLDIDSEAIEFSRKMAEKKNVNHISWHKAFAQNLGRFCKDGFKPDVVEMVGLLDYYPEKEAISLLSRIYNNMAKDGWLITCNVNHNIEEPFLTKGVNWPLIYRSPEQLATLLVKAGFSPDDIVIVYEPLKIHGLAIARKSDKVIPFKKKPSRERKSSLNVILQKHRQGLSDLNKPA